MHERLKRIAQPALLPVLPIAALLASCSENSTQDKTDVNGPTATVTITEKNTGQIEVEMDREQLIEKVRQENIGVVFVEVRNYLPDFEQTLKFERVDNLPNRDPIHDVQVIIMNAGMGGVNLEPLVAAFEATSCDGVYRLSSSTDHGKTWQVIPQLQDPKTGKTSETFRLKDDCTESLVLINP